MEFLASLGWIGWLVIAVAVAVIWNWRTLRKIPDRVEGQDATLRHYADGRPDQPPGFGGDLQ